MLNQLRVEIRKWNTLSYRSVKGLRAGHIPMPGISLLTVSPCVNLVFSSGPSSHLISSLTPSLCVFLEFSGSSVLTGHWEHLLPRCICITWLFSEASFNFLTFHSLVFLKFSTIFKFPLWQTLWFVYFFDSSVIFCKYWLVCNAA